MFKYLDLQGMVEKLCELIKIPKLRCEFGRKAKEIVNKRFYTFRPSVSVIIPNYNYSHYLKKRLKTIFNQDYDNIEVIILDDRSTDSSLQLIQRYENMPNVTVIINEKNSGSAFKQWLKGMLLASGEIIWIAEADDLCKKSFIKTLIPYFQDPDVKLAYCDSYCIDSSGEILKNYNYYDNYLKELSPTKWNREYKQDGDAEVNDGLAVKNTIPNVSGVLFRKRDVAKNLTEIEKAITKFRFCGDWNFYLHLLNGGKICYTPMKLNYHRRHDSSIVGECHKAGDSARIMLTEFYANHELVLKKYRISRETFDKMVGFVSGDLKKFNFPSIDERVFEKYYSIVELRSLLG